MSDAVSRFACRKSDEPLHLRYDAYTTPRQRQHLSVLFHVLASNPKLLYAPNTSQVEQVMHKVGTAPRTRSLFIRVL